MKLRTLSIMYSYHFENRIRDTLKNARKLIKKKKKKKKKKKRKASRSFRFHLLYNTPVGNNTAGPTAVIYTYQAVFSFFVWHTQNTIGVH